MKGFVRLMKTGDVPAGSGASVRKSGRRWAVFNTGQTFYAVEDRCPHRGAPLSDGPLEGSVVTCTWHGWDVDVARGTLAEDDTVLLPPLELRVERGWIWARLPDRKTSEEND